MSKRLISIFRGIAVFSVVFSLFIFNGCNKDDEPAPPFTGSIWELINEDQFKQSASVPAANALDSLIKYLVIGGLDDDLDGTTEFTFFAPSNSAFLNLIGTVGALDNISPSVVAGVLKYHMIDGALAISELTPTGSGAGIDTKYSDINPCSGAATIQVIKVNSNGSLLTGSTDTEITIVDGDNQTTENGVVHVTEKVLIPPSVGASLTPILGTHAATVLLGADFTYLAQAMYRADCGVAGVTPLSNILATPATIATLTVFLPPNAVFEGTAAALSITVTQFINNFTPAQWRSILLNHIVTGTNNLAALTNATQLTTQLDAAAKLTVTDVPVSASTPLGKILGTSGGATGLGGTIQAPLFVADIPGNGIAHVVGKILIPN